MHTRNYKLFSPIQARKICCLKPNQKDDMLANFQSITSLALYYFLLQHRKEKKKKHIWQCQRHLQVQK